MSIESLAGGVRRGDRRALARAVTLVESIRRDHREQAQALLDALLPATGGSVRIGITGAPGVGKSTLIEALGQVVLARGHRLAVLSVDPSSALAGGSILGDKTRMEMLSRDPRAYIRPSPSAGTLGGVARRTRESILVFEAAGFDVILVETVGVGQSETLVADMTDCFLLMLLPVGGDELQGIKRGIMELADIVLVNKADGDLAAAAGRAAAEYASALRLMPRRYRDWQVPVRPCSARTGAGIEAVWETVTSFIAMSRDAGYFSNRREQQQIRWFRDELNHGLVEMLREDPELRADMKRAEADVRAHRLTAAGAARRLIASFIQSRSYSP